MFRRRRDKEDFAKGRQGNEQGRSDKKEDEGARVARIDRVGVEDDRVRAGGRNVGDVDRRDLMKTQRDIFDEFFSDFSRMEKVMSEVMQNMFSGVEGGAVSSSKPFVYGFSMRTGEDGKPIIREFGNVKAFGGDSKDPVISDAQEPLVDIVERGDEIIVIAEVPGVNKTDIELEAADSVLYISVETSTKKYYKEVDLPQEIVGGETEASYNNGILEVKLRKKGAKKARGKKIEIK